MLAKVKLGKQAADLCTSSLTQQLVDAYFDEGRWRRYISDLCAIYRQRRDAMLDALAEFFPREAEWTQPGGGLFIWATLPDFIDTSDLLAKAMREEQRRVRARARPRTSTAAAAARCGSTSPARTSNDIVEGVRRIGKVVDEQIALYWDVHRKRTADAASERRSRQDEVAKQRPPDEPMADVVQLPRRRDERRAQGS